MAAKSTHHILSHITAAEVAWQLDGGYEIFFQETEKDKMQIGIMEPK